MKLKARRAIQLANFLILFYTASGLASIPILEATSESGYGHTKIRWTAYWNGACAERVGLEIGYGLQEDFADNTGKVIDYARSTIPHLLKKCPQTEVVHVESAAPHVRGAQRAFYRFELHGSENWAAKNSYWYHNRVDALVAEGFSPAKIVPGRKALVRLQEEIFEARYGPRLQGTMVAKDFSRHHVEGSNPLRVSHHIISGHWYELGSSQANGSCQKSKDGYSLWGTFTMKVSHGSSGLQISRKYCSEADEKGFADKINLSNVRLSNAQRDWGLSSVAQATNEISKQLQAMNIDVAASQKEFREQRKPLYKSQKLAIYPAQENWCMERTFEAYYTVPNETRDKAFGGNYRKVIGQRLRAVVKEFCGDALSANVQNYSKSDEGYWDSMSFQFRPIRPEPFSTGLNYPKLVTHRLSQKAKDYKARALEHHFGKPCENGPFCELPAGKYLNAIYNGRGDLISSIGKQHEAEMLKLIGDYNSQYGDDQGLINNFFKRMATNRGLITQTTNKYLYDYQGREARCFKPGALSKTFRMELQTMGMVNPDGSVEEGSPMISEATYRVNPEFRDILETVATSSGAPRSDSAYLRTSLRLVFQGLVKLRQDYDCQSPEIQRFEENLRHFAHQESENESFDVLPMPAAIEPTGSANSASNGIQHVTSYEPQTVSKRAAEDANQLSPSEQRARMNAELKVLSDAFIAHVNKQNEEFKQAMKKAKDQQESLALMKEFNQRMAEYREKIDTETQRIKEKYK